MSIHRIGEKSYMRKIKRWPLAMVLVILFFSAIAAHCAQDDTSKTAPPDGNAAFKQLPEEIQYRILDEATGVNHECTQATVTSYLYSCPCIKEEYIKARTIQGPEPSRRTLKDEVRQRCIKKEVMTQYYYDRCVSGVESVLKVYDTYCKCFGAAMVTQFAERPRLSYFSELDLMQVSRDQCGYNKYLKDQINMQSK